MKVTLTAGLSDKDKEAFENEFNTSGLLRERLISVLHEKIRTKEKFGRDEVHYDSPNWELKQVDVNATIRAYLEIIELLK